VLPKANRLQKPQEFTAVYQGGTRHTATHLTLRALQQPTLGEQPIRIGISISQKVSKRAVDRNLIKRRIRAACRQLLPQLPSNWSVVVVARGSATQCDYRQFLRELKQLLAEAGILHGH